jgi:hypothetical protein
VLGESVETVWRMAETERVQLISLLLGEEEEDGGPSHYVAQEGEAKTKIPLADKDVARNLKVSQESNEKEGPDLNIQSATETRMEGIYRNLHMDTVKVKKLLRGSLQEDIEDEMISAYLEAYLDNPHRVQVVVEEFLGVGETNDPSRVLRQKSMEVEMSEKGKGKGKSSQAQVSRSGQDSSENGSKRLRSPDDEEPGTKCRRMTSSLTTEETVHLPRIRRTSVAPFLAQSESTSIGVEEEEFVF